MNQYPVLFLSFKDVDETLLKMRSDFLGFTIAQFCIEQSYLAESEKVNSDYKAVFARLKSRAASLTDIKGSILTIMKMMQAYYEKPVVLLDEYDVPVARARTNVGSNPGNSEYSIER